MPLPSVLFEHASRIDLPAFLTEGTHFKNMALTQAYQPLRFVRAQQEQGNWCWAAVSFAVSRFFNPQTGWTQCKIATDELRKPCCANAVACNEYWYLDRALTRIGNYVDFVSGRTTLQNLNQIINVEKRPLCIRIAWQNGGAHFVTITGIDPNGMLYVADPHYGDSRRAYSTFPNVYEGGGGTWTHCFFTKPVSQPLLA
jgi:hypothetical protein